MPLKVSILVVEDERDIRFIMQVALSMDVDFDVRFASSGPEALRMLEDDDWTPDLAMVDVMMPEMTGIDLMTAFRLTEATAHMPIIFVTGHVKQYHSDGLLDAGALAVISKPFDPLTLAATVRELWSKHRLLARRNILSSSEDHFASRFYTN